MYRKEAIRKVVREVHRILPELRAKQPWADWRMAVTGTRAAHPDWFKNIHNGDSLEAELRQAGVDMSEGFKPGDFVGNQSLGS